MIKDTLTGKQKRFLRAMGATMVPVVQIGKAGLAPAIVVSAIEAVNARELIKIRVLQNCFEAPKVVLQMLAERTNSELVQVIGRNGLLYKPSKDKPKIELP